MPTDFIKLAKEKVSNADVVSFDIFDTLLLRPYIKPTDVFNHMEKALRKPMFNVCRIEAEAEARQLHPELEDITLDMIYDEIADEFKDLKQKEMEWEAMVLRANPELKQVYDYAVSKSKRIVITSDMYLPAEFLANVLRKNGYDGWEKLYVSGVENACKGNGGLFRKILTDCHVCANQVLHIGDNKKSDYKRPRKLGMESILYQPVLKQFLKSNKRNRNIPIKKINSLGASILLGILAYRWQVNRFDAASCADYWANLGYEYAGPTAYAYSRFIQNTIRANNVDSLLFVARDGYLLQKVFATFDDMPNSYIYAPRFLNNICRLDYVRKNKDQAQAIIDFYRQAAPAELAKAVPCDCPHTFIEKNKQIFVSLAKQQMQKYRAYLNEQAVLGKKIAMVDTITIYFSSQKFLQAALQQEILGVYWGISNSKDDKMYAQVSWVGKHSASDIYPMAQFFTSNWGFVEFLITSPEHPIKFVDDEGKPVYAKEENKYELRRAELYPHIVNGALDFAGDVADFFGGHDIYLSSQDIIGWLEHFIQNPLKADLEEMAQIRVGEDPAHKVMMPLFCADIGLIDCIKHPSQSRKLLQRAVWLTNTQRFLLCLAKPFSLRSRGIKRIALSIFPYLNKPILNLTISFGNAWYYKFLIGKKI